VWRRGVVREKRGWVLVGRGDGSTKLSSTDLKGLATRQVVGFEPQERARDLPAGAIISQGRRFVLVCHIRMRRLWRGADGKRGGFWFSLCFAGWKAKQRNKEEEKKPRVPKKEACSVTGPDRRRKSFFCGATRLWEDGWIET